METPFPLANSAAFRRLIARPGKTESGSSRTPTVLANSREKTAFSVSMTKCSMPYFWQYSTAKRSSDFQFPFWTTVVAEILFFHFLRAASRMSVESRPPVKSTLTVPSLGKSPIAESKSLRNDSSVSSSDRSPPFQNGKVKREDFPDSEKRPSFITKVLEVQNSRGNTERNSDLSGVAVLKTEHSKSAWPSATTGIPRHWKTRMTDSWSVATTNPPSTKA